MANPLSNSLFRQQPDGSYLFLGKYPVKVDPEDLATSSADPSVLSYLESIRQGKLLVLYQTAAFDDMARQLAPVADRITKVVEFFGGAGLATTIFRSVLNPQEHHLWEMDEYCIRHLRKRLPSGVTLHEGNSYLPGAAPEHVDEGTFLVADFNNFTVLDLTRMREKGVALDRALRRKPAYVELTDCTTWKLEANQKIYSKELGTPYTDRDSYVRVWSQWLWARYGYSIRSARGYYGATSYLLSREPPVEVGWKKSADLFERYAPPASEETDVLGMVG